MSLNYPLVHATASGTTFGAPTLREIERVFLKFRARNNLIHHAILLGLRG